MHWPKVSEKKKSEMEMLLEREKVKKHGKHDRDESASVGLLDHNNSDLEADLSANSRQVPKYDVRKKKKVINRLKEE
jgi:hypothetical protein